MSFVYDHHDHAVTNRVLDLQHRHITPHLIWLGAVPAVVQALTMRCLDFIQRRLPGGGCGLFLTRHPDASNRPSPRKQKARSAGPWSNP
ncbi:hypothetical protein D5047_19130 [Verminephrobacter eiseniae]|nr:hypothetical protein [Verminephrobacter eiseniae]